MIFLYPELNITRGTGSYGSVPWSVLHATIQHQIDGERNPDRFHPLTMRPLDFYVHQELLVPLVGADFDELDSPRP